MIKRIPAVLIFDEEFPERKVLLKSAFSGQFIEVYEDPIGLEVHYIPERDMDKEVVDLLKVKKGGNQE